MTNPQDVTPIATIKPRRFVAKVPCPRPGCGGEITLTAGDKGSAWGNCRKPSAHVGKSGKANTCGASVTFTPPQTRALLEGKPVHVESTPPASPPPAPAAKPASSSRRRVAAAGTGDGKPAGGDKPKPADDPPRTAARGCVGFFEF